MSRHLSSSNLRWVAIHATLPIFTDTLQGRQSISSAAPVIHIVLGTLRHVGQDGIGSLSSRMLELGADSRDKGEDNIHSQREHQQIDDQLGPPRQDAGDIGMSL